MHEGAYKRFINAVEQISFSGEYAIENQKQVIFVTERAEFSLGPEGLILQEIAPGIDLQKDVLGQMEFLPIMADPVLRMDARIFRPGPMGLVLGKS